MTQTHLQVMASPNDGISQGEVLDFLREGSGLSLPATTVLVELHRDSVVTGYGFSVVSTPQMGVIVKAVKVLLIAIR